MKEDIRTYINNLFAGAPDNSKVRELKEEILSNINARYDDLISQGRSEEEAYKIAIDGIGDVNELIKGLENDKIYNYARREADRRRSAAIVSVAVGLYFIAVAVQLLFSIIPGLRPEIGCVIMFVIFAIATAMIVYNAMSRPKYRKSDDTIVEEFKEWNHTSNENIQIYRSLKSVVWTLIVVIYLVISFYYESWAYSWIIFIIGAAIQNILKLVFEMNKRG